MSMLSKMSAVAVSILAMSAVAYADPGAEAPSFNQVDKNKDGVIEKNEAAAVKGLDWTKADSNHDGKIDAAEFRAAQLNNSGSGGMGGGSAPKTYTR